MGKPDIGEDIEESAHLAVFKKIIKRIYIENKNITVSENVFEINNKKKDKPSTCIY